MQSRRQCQCFQPFVFGFRMPFPQHAVQVLVIPSEYEAAALARLTSLSDLSSLLPNFPHACRVSNNVPSLTGILKDCYVSVLEAVMGLVYPEQSCQALSTCVSFLCDEPLQFVSCLSLPQFHWGLCLLARLPPAYLPFCLPCPLLESLNLYGPLDHCYSTSQLCLWILVRGRLYTLKSQPLNNIYAFGILHLN